MPSAKKVHWAQLRVGIMALAAMAVLGVLIFLFTGQKKLFAREAKVFTYMMDSAALAPGSPVRLNGILIGRVDKVELSGSRQPDRVVRVQMSVEASRLPSISVDSVASIAAENVLGTKYINIKKGQSARTLEPGGELRALDTREFQELVESAFPLLQSLHSVLGRLDAIVGRIEQGKGSVGKLLMDDELYNKLASSVSEFEKVSKTVGSGRGTIGKLLYDEGLYNDARAVLQRTDAVIQDLQQGQGTAGKLLKDPALYDEARSTVAELHRLIDGVNAGKGTAGKLLKDEAVYRQIESLLTKLASTMDRLNAGQGTLGQMLVNPQLYESIEGLSTEMKSLIKDVHANPKKFLRIKLGLF